MITVMEHLPPHQYVSMLLAAFAQVNVPLDGLLVLLM